MDANPENSVYPLEWAKSFLAEAAKDRAEAEYVLANPAEYDRSVRMDARGRLVRLNDPDGVVPMVTALVEALERLRKIEDAAWMVDRQKTLHTNMCSQQGNAFICQCARSHLAAALGPDPEWLAKQGVV